MTTDEIFNTVRAATRALYPEARIPETPMPKICETIAPAYRDQSGNISVTLNRSNEGDLYVALSVGDQLITLDTDHIKALVNALQTMARAAEGDRVVPLKNLGRSP
jgi:hypothetical protein